MTESIRIVPQKTLKYNFTALGPENKFVRGTIKAPNEAVAEHLVAERGLRPMNVEPVGSPLSLEKMLPSFFGVKSQEVPTFARQLATLLESGIDILSALMIISEQSGSRAFKKVLRSIVGDLRSGVSFSMALSRHPTLFNDIYCRTVAMAEQTGGLEVILRQMADFEEKQKAAKKKVTGALTYPAIMIFVGIAVAGIMLTVVLPSMIDMFVQMDTELPLPTQILMGLSDFIGDHGKYLGLGLLVIVAGLVTAIKRPEGRLYLDKMILKAPVIGPPMHSSEVARFSRTASVLLGAGLALQEVMAMIPSAIGNRALQASLRKVGHDLIRGQGLYEPMSRDKLFPPLLVQMVMVGEESNTLAESLAVSANFYEADSSDKVAAMVKVIQPGAMIFVAGMVGFMAMAVMMPMYSITGAF